MHQARCVENLYHQAITVGRLYLVIGALGIWWIVIDDRGDEVLVDRSMFSRN